MAMTETVTKASALAAIDDERAGWETLVTEVGPDRLEEPAFAGGWSFRDITAHLMGWRQYSIARLEAGVKGQPEPPAPWPSDLQEDDEINAWLYERDRNIPTSKVMKTASNSYERLRNVVDAMPEEALNDPNWLPWFEGEPLGPFIVDRRYFGHLHEEHEPDIRAWLAKTA
jgi:hypothetical protein